MIDAIRTVAVVGVGYMGGGIAQSLARAGYPVVIADTSPEVADAAYARMVDEAEGFERTREFADGSAAAVRANIHVADSIEEAAADVDYVQEAVAEVTSVKHDVLGRISTAARDDTIIGSNTSSIPVHELDVAVHRPERFLNVHWSNPAPFVPGIELIVGRRTDPAIVPVVQQLLASAGRSGAQVADVPGFVLNRLQYVLFKEAASLVEEGVATLEDVDTIVRTTFGFRLAFFGPFAIADMAGLDVYANAFDVFQAAYGDRLAAPRLLLDAVASGRHGVKNGRGLTGDISAASTAELVAYRGHAYSRLLALREQLGPSPLEHSAGEHHLHAGATGDGSQGTGDAAGPSADTRKGQ